MLTGLFLKLFLPCPHGGRCKRPPRASTSPNARWGSTALYLHTTGLPLSRMRRNTPRAAVLRRRKKSAHRDKSRECGSRSGVHRYGVHRMCAQKHAAFEKIYSQRAPARSICLSVVLQRFRSTLRRTCECSHLQSASGNSRSRRLHAQPPKQFQKTLQAPVQPAPVPIGTGLTATGQPGPQQTGPKTHARTKSLKGPTARHKACAPACSRRRILQRTNTEREEALRPLPL